MRATPREVNSGFPSKRIEIVEFDAPDSDSDRTTASPALPIGNSPEGLAYRVPVRNTSPPTLSIIVEELRSKPRYSPTCTNPGVEASATPSSEAISLPRSNSRERTAMRRMAAHSVAEGGCSPCDAAQVLQSDSRPWSAADGNLLSPEGSCQIQRHVQGQPAAVGQVHGVLRRRVRRGCADGAREGADRAGGRTRGPVSLLHRRLHAVVPGKGLQRRGDDRGGARGLRNPGRRFTRARRTDAQRREPAVDVRAPLPRLVPSTPCAP